MAGFHTKLFLKHDDYMTPNHAWEDIKHFISKDKIIWEAFYGDGESGRYMKEEMGLNVIHEPIDFFNDDTLPEFDIIISNPPFSKSREVFQRLKELDKPFIIICPSSKINTSYVRENYINQKLQIIIPRKRIHFIKHIDGKPVEGLKKACNFDCFYYCYKIDLPDDIMWLE
jgi:hypothetical protein|tara:strand:- start:656 stop:1168 length:513 start_codon:yes stop_codon:yes gene_type:complete